ncbi:cytochrome P450 [Dactylosporangium sp. NBC_01737]|uniref:cytochrome P450 family protein n=1 Tax=Dactylosporangium sp. NBC_01737 TaxID=2975959 RepID=UPI002E1105F6|nr:cytochrome P450 [Dactylosporangium sp. NBC_01737]
MTTTAMDALLADPHGFAAKLRAVGRAHQVTLPDGSPVWLLTRYEDVRAALADPRLSLDKRNSTGGWAGFSLPPRLDANLLNMDAPDHTRIRRLVAPAFTPRRVEALRPRIERTANDLLDRLAADTDADLVSGYATPLSIATICDMLGLPDAGLDQMRAWTNTLMSPPPDDPKAPARAVMAIERFLVDLIRRKRAEPTDDLLTAMITAHDAGDRLSEEELTSLAFLTIFAGYENSINLIGNCVLALLQHPHLLDDVRDDADLRRAAIDETLRHEPAAQLSIRRFALEDLTYGPATIPAGATVLLSLAAANRDPSIVGDPDAFRLRRPSAPHLGLGHGPHHCLGAALAVLETDVAVGELLRRHPRLTLAKASGLPAWRRSFRSRSLSTLRVTLKG